MYLNGPDLRSVSRGHVIPQGDVSPDPLPKLANFWGRTRAESIPSALPSWPSGRRWTPPLPHPLLMTPYSRRLLFLLYGSQGPHHGPHGRGTFGLPVYSEI